MVLVAKRAEQREIEIELKDSRDRLQDTMVVGPAIVCTSGSENDKPILRYPQIEFGDGPKIGRIPPLDFCAF